MTGRLVVLSGPSGVGKDTVLEAWAKADPRVLRIVTSTTRPPRDGEADGRDYWFLSHAEFDKRRRAGRFLEAKKVHGNWYASPLDEIDAALAAGRIAVLKIDVQGAMEVSRRRKDAALIFLAPPSMDELERRIRSRGTESEAAIRSRLADAGKEIAEQANYDHVVVNNDVDKAVAQIVEALGG